MNTLLTPQELPESFTYPEEFLRIINQGLIDFDPWIILRGEQLRTRLHGINKRFPKENLIPFARREDNDDVACWQQGSSHTVYIIHDFSSLGYENRRELNSFWEWLRQALEDTINYSGD